MRRFALIAILSACSTISAARVTESAVLCIPDRTHWDTPLISTSLQRLAQAIARTAVTNRQPEVIITSTVLPASIYESPQATREREVAVIHRLRTLGVETSHHESLREAGRAPRDIGCGPISLAIQVEAIFWHPILQ